MQILPSKAASLCKQLYKPWNAGSLSMFSAMLPDVTSVTHISRDDVQAVVLIRSESSVVVFRGTRFTDQDSASRNADTQLQNDAGIEVHGGYREGLDLVWDDILDILDARQTAEPLIVIGHSAGGAMATIFAVRMFQRRLVDKAKAPYVGQLITFAAPMAGDDSLASAVGMMSWGGALVQRYTTTNDVVPRLPRFWFPGCWKYVPSSAELYIDTSCKIHRNPWRLHRWIDGGMFRVTRARFRTARDAHGIDNYEFKLQMAGS